MQVDVILHINRKTICKLLILIICNCFRTMGMDHLDLYLVHWPVKLKPWAFDAIPKEDHFEELDLKTTWLGMEKCLELGLCRSIGVSNFSSKKLDQLLEFASVPPAVNQVHFKLITVINLISYREKSN